MAWTTPCMGAEPAEAIMACATKHVAALARHLKLPLCLLLCAFMMVYLLSEHVAWLGLPTAEAAASPSYVSFVSIPVLEHVLPMKHLIEELLRRGHRVSFALPEMCRNWVSDLPGLEFISLGTMPSPIPHALTLKSAVGNVGIYSSYLASLQYYASFYKPMYHPLRADYGEDAPTIVVADRYAFAAMDVANNLSLPFIIHNPFLLLDIDDPPSYVPAPFSQYPMATQTVWQRCANGLHRLRFRLGNAAVAASLAKARSEFALPSTPSYGERLVLTNTVFGLEHPRPLSPLHRLVGALTSLSPPSPSPELDSFLRRDRDGCVVLVDFGADVVLSTDMVSLLMTALREVECRTVWKLSPEMHKSFLHDEVTRDLLASSDVFFSVSHSLHVPNTTNVRFLVTSGGFSAVQSALLAGTPILSIPFSAEHAEFTDRIVRAGAGVAIEATKVTAASLHFASDLLLSHDRFALAAERVGGLLTTGGGVDAAVNAIEAVAARGTAGWIPARETQPLLKTYLLDVYAVYGAVLCGVAVVLRTLLSACLSVFARHDPLKKVQ
ncbi:hypothetical protein SDRG_08431 [Saprolegnia diclina VS20]|uniref:UDP-glycosyltransferases domain-containing protein n=1 Tax=Saprolegnia diclina (strain VS20) TaxID=1156394 RepID=T0Q8K4_SAPDV|nr:hypothetical protein SDRG_08431 [Saprolegnia diclina VS20]EQC34229.1 hypothetical protein SDRG_08431 [Saprolegnia diclina VS20]|eukprot:XP_008612541.1 hypothetical protein SDRG_08431 [Saprolegnia diclina VS20]